MKKNRIVFLAVLLLLVACSHKGKHNQHDGHNHHEGHDHHDGHDHHEGHNHHHGHSHGDSSAKQADEHTDEIIFTDEQARLVGLETIVLSPGSFNQVIKTSGEILPAQGDDVVVVATCNGIVSFANSSITEGLAVKRGETLVNISSEHIHLGDPSKTAKIAYETAEREYLRAQSLIKDQIISTKSFEQIRLNYETAKTVYEAHAGHLSESGLSVTSPISGFVKNRQVRDGEYVSIGQPLVTIAKNKKLQLRAEISEKYFKHLKNIESVNFKLSYDDNLYKLSELNGRMLSFAKESDRMSAYIPISFEFDNPGTILSGSFAEVYLLAAADENLLKLPISALSEEQGLYFVYLSLGDELYKKQEFQPGKSDGEYVEVLSGLKTGDEVVSRGVVQVRLAANATVVPEGHSH